MHKETPCACERMARLEARVVSLERIYDVIDKMNTAYTATFDDIRESLQQISINLVRLEERLKARGPWAAITRIIKILKGDA